MHHYAEKGLGTAANAVITQTNPFGKSFIKVLDIFGDAHRSKTKTAPLYILQKQTATPKDYTNLWELSPTRYSNYDRRKIIKYVI